jgi:hypothetical protein
MTDLHTAAKQALIDEATIQMADHPSKDARFFAKSVYEYLMAEPEQPAQQEPATSAAKGAIMGAAYDFRDSHLSGSTNLKRSAHAVLESAVDAALAEQPAQQCKWPICQSEEYQQALAEQIKRELYTGEPVQRTWVGLTDEKHAEAIDVCLHIGVEGLVFWLEDKLKEKNT